MATRENVYAKIQQKEIKRYVPSGSGQFQTSTFSIRTMQNFYTTGNSDQSKPQWHVPMYTKSNCWLASFSSPTSKFQLFYVQVCNILGWEILAGYHVLGGNNPLYIDQNNLTITLYNNNNNNTRSNDNNIIYCPWDSRKWRHDSKYKKNLSDDVVLNNRKLSTVKRTVVTRNDARRPGLMIEIVTSKDGGTAGG